MNKIKIIYCDSMTELEEKVNDFLTKEFEQLPRHKEIKNIQYSRKDKYCIKSSCMIWYNYE